MADASSTHSATKVFLGLCLLLILTVTWLVQRQQTQPIVDAPPGSKLQCVSYAPYYKDGMDPRRPETQITPNQIDADLKALSGLTDCVRTYAVSQGLDYVPQSAKKYGMKVILGVWVSWTDSDNRAQLARAVDLANTYPDVVKSIVVGNEVLLRGEQTEQSLRAYLQWAQAHTTTAITYAEVWEYWLKHPGLEKDVDFVTVHILPYWEDLPVAIEQAVGHTTAVMDKLSAQFGKPLLIGETGWPSQGRQRFGAAPGLVNQARYLREFLQTAEQRHWQYNVIEAVDQPWKRGLEGTVGGYWGVLDTALQPKFFMQGPLAESRDGGWSVLSGAVLSLLVLWHGRRRKRPGFPLLNNVLLAFMVGLIGFYQFGYVIHAARDQSEYLMMGSWLLLGVGLMLLQTRHWYGVSVSPSLENALVFLFAVGIFSVSALLAYQGRYVDFPLLLSTLPLAVVAVSVWSRQTTDHNLPQQTGLFARPAQWGLMLILMLSTQLACMIAMLEPGNHTAWCWAGLNVLAALVLPLHASRPVSVA